LKNYITTERADLYEPNITIAMKFSIVGNPTDNEVVNAIYAAMQANEILNTKIAIVPNGQAWYEESNKQENMVTISDDNWRDIFYEQEKIRFRFEQGELMRVYLLNGEPKKQILILAHHLAGDGKSLVYFIEDIMNALSGKKPPLKKWCFYQGKHFQEKAKCHFYFRCT
jgi:hypothetical protein